jgi:chitinase
MTTRRAASVLGRMLALTVAVFAILSWKGGQDQPLAIIAYVHGNGADVNGSAVKSLTHINFSFLRFKAKELVVGGSRDSMAIAKLVALKNKNPKLKILLSVGGWGGCEPCSEIFSTAQGRGAFAASAKRIIEQFGADGIDLDWEYPAIEGYPGHRFVPEDRHNFTLLVQALRDVLGSTKEITFAIGGFTECLMNSVEWDQVMPVVDKVNVMTYDLVNGFSTTTGHHTPLYSCPGQVESVDHAVRVLDSLGVPRQKIIIGAAFYARVWENVEPKNDGLFQQGKFKSYVGFKQLEDYFAAHSASKTFWDSTAQAPYAYDSTDRLFATYDDERSVALKTQYARDHGLGGIMFWELSGDRATGGLLDAIVQTAQAGPGPSGLR